MRRIFASFQRVRSPRRFGAVLALVALLVQLALPGAAALAMGADPLQGAPICRTARDGHPVRPHKAVHTGCPLCQAPAAAWGFLPPPSPAVLVAPYAHTDVVWQTETIVAAPFAVAGSRARGPPAAA